jgi:hypothetical protein
MSSVSCEEKKSKISKTIPPNHATIEIRNSQAEIPEMMDSIREGGLSIQMSVNLRSRSHVRIKTASAMSKITYTIMPRNAVASV